MKNTLSILSILAFAVSANAATIITPTAATSTVAASNSSATALVNGAGLSATVATGDNTATVLSTITHNNTQADTYVTGPVGTGGTNYFTNGGTPPVFTFSLAPDISAGFDNINSIVLWNYYVSAGGSNNGTLTFNLTFYSNAAATAQIGSTLTGLSLTKGVSNPIAEQVFFTGGVNYDGVRSIKMTLTNNYGSNRVGLSEVRFSAIPEPSAVALLGLAGFGLIFRRRRHR